MYKVLDLYIYINPIQLFPDQSNGKNVNFSEEWIFEGATELVISKQFELNTEL